jgi:hypothetical protein
MVIGAMLFPALKGEAGCLPRVKRRSAANSQRQLEVFAFFFICCASPIGGEQIAVPIVMALHNGNKRIGKAQTTIRSALPIVIEIAY